MELLAISSSSSSSILNAKFSHRFSATAAKNTTTQCSFSPRQTSCRRRRRRAPAVKNSYTEAWNGYAGGSGSFGLGFRPNNQNNATKTYTRLESCLVVPPPTGTKPRAIVQFLGGAFLGAVPELTYRSLSLIFLLDCPFRFIVVVVLLKSTGSFGSGQLCD